MGVFRAIVRVLAFLALTSLLLFLWALLLPLGRTPRRTLRRLWCQGSLVLLGVRLHVEGAPCAVRPTLFVANHVSYLDIPILGTILDATFIAKAEVAGWPFFGHLARLADTIFIRRHWRQALIQRDLLASRLSGGESLVLFAEGTSSNGLDVLPLKSSLLSVAETGVVDRPIAVQPVAMAHLRLANESLIDQTTCDYYAWHGDCTLLPHLWQALLLPGVEIGVRLHAPLAAEAVADRKRLALLLRDTLRNDLHQCRRAAQLKLGSEEGLAAERAAPTLGSQKAW